MAKPSQHERSRSRTQQPGFGGGHGRTMRPTRSGRASRRVLSGPIGKCRYRLVARDTVLVNPENRVASDFRWQAQDSRALGSALYGVLLDRCADDIEAGGITADLLKKHLGYRRRDVLPLRLLAGVHAV